MNERIKELASQVLDELVPETWTALKYDKIKEIQFRTAELIVAECRTVVTEVYRNTPLELCGPLLTADEEIAKHFYGVEE